MMNDRDKQMNNKKDEALKLALYVLNEVRNETFRLQRNGQTLYAEEKVWNAVFVIKQALAEQCVCGEPNTPGTHRTDGPCYAEQPEQQEPVTVLPDGSAFAVMSYPLPKDHWLYADRKYNDGEYEPVELGKPVLTHELRDAVVSAMRYAIRGATDCGKEMDFDPDALVQNAVYALCGPFTSPPANANAGKPWVGLDQHDIDVLFLNEDGVRFARYIEAKLKEKNT